MIVITSFEGNMVIARKRETRKRAIKALSFHFEVSRIIQAMLIKTSDETAATVITSCGFKINEATFFPATFFIQI